MDKIRDRLYLGSWKAAEPLVNNPAWVVVTVAIDSPVRGHHFYPISDPGDDPLDQKLQDAAIKTVVNALNTTDKPVLVHCVAGVNRSASVVIGALMRMEGLKLAEAHNVVKAARPGINPCNRQLENVLESVGSDETFSTTDFTTQHLSYHEQQVEACYREVLKRAADPDGMRHYSERLAVQPEYTVEKLKETLRKSDEYKKRFGNE